MTGVRRAMLSLALTALTALSALLAGCGGGSVTALPSPTVASSPSAGPTDVEIEPAEAGTATAEPAIVAPEPTKHSGHSATQVPDAGPPSGVTVRLTEKDAGRTIRVRPGTVIIVKLTGGPGSYLAPTTDAPNVLRADSTSGGYPAEGPTSATFTAIGQGTAQITSTTDAACLHSEPACMIPQQQFTVTIRAQ